MRPIVGGAITFLLFLALASAHAADCDFTLNPGDYYGILGVHKFATTAEIKQAYRQLAFQFHPDRNLGREQWAEDRFKLIAGAYEVLSDPQERRRYDLFRSAPIPVTSSAAAEIVMRNVRESEFRGVELLYRVALASLKIHVPLYSARPYTEVSLQREADKLAELWTRVGNLKEHHGGRMDVTEAVYRAAFTSLKRFREFSPRVYERYFQLGVDYLDTGVALMKGSPNAFSDPTDLAYLRMLERVLAFAEESRDSD